MKTTVTQTPYFQVDADLDFSKKSALLKFSGTVEEEEPFISTGDFLLNMRDSVSEVQLDTHRITRINSRGVRSWLDFMKRAQTFPFRYSFSHLSEVLIEKANGFPGLLGKEGTQVLRFEAPYLCRGCRSRTPVLLETRDFDLSRRDWRAPELSCKKCSSPLEFDEQENTYFRFLGRLQPKKG